MDGNGSMGYNGLMINVSNTMENKPAMTGNGNHNTCKNGDDQGIDIVLPTLSPYDKLRPISSGLHMDPMSYWDLVGLVHWNE